MKLGARQQILIATILGILILVGFIFLLWMPRYRELNELNKEKESKEKANQQDEDRIAQYERMVKELPKIEAKLEELNLKMPAQPGLSSIIRNIQQISKEAGVDFVSIKPAEITQGAQYAELPMEIVVTGRFHDVVDFLYRVYTLPRKMKTTAVSIAEAEAGLPYIEVTVNSSAFMFGQAPQIESGEGAKKTSGGAKEDSTKSDTTSGQQQAP